jgi:hypothetical protein
MLPGIALIRKFAASLRLSAPSAPRAMPAISPIDFPLPSPL